MQFKVSGTNRDTGARMILEFEASNRAMAERKATQSGMGEVLHCEQVRDASEPAIERKSRRGEFEQKSAAWKVILIGVIVVIVAMVVWWWMKGR